MVTHFADRLQAAIRAQRAPVCVGLDPVLERLPASVQAGGTPVDAMLRFGQRVIDRVASIVPAVKINSAFFERYRGAGVDAYFELTDYAARAGLLVIGDCKRGDIGHSAVEYAAAQFGATGDAAPDAVTLHSYLGADAIMPFAEIARSRGRGVFVLVRTSNPSAAALQDVDSGAAVSVAERVADLLNEWSATFGERGAGGYDLLGAVVAARDPDMARALRTRMPHTLFLVPGYGAQGSTAADIAHCFQDGAGAIVNASRSVIFAYEQPRWQAEYGDDWEACIAAAARAFADDVARAVGL